MYTCPSCGQQVLDRDVSSARGIDGLRICQACATNIALSAKEKREAILRSLTLTSEEMEIAHSNPVLYNRLRDIYDSFRSGLKTAKKIQPLDSVVLRQALSGLNEREQRLVLGVVYTKNQQSVARNRLTFGMLTGIWLCALFLGAVVGGVALWAFALYTLGVFIFWFLSLLGLSSPLDSPINQTLLRYVDETNPSTRTNTAGASSAMEARVFLSSIHPSRFESEVVRVLRHFGYEGAVTGKPGDLGADALLRDSAGRRIVLQVKKFSPGHAVGTPELQKLQGSMRHFNADGGMLVTLSYFSPQAERYAKRDGIRIIDGDEFVHMFLDAQGANGSKVVNE